MKLLICLLLIILCYSGIAKSLTESSSFNGCLNDCGGNGICENNSICICNSGWGGIDCSINIQEPTSTPTPLKCLGNPVCGGPSKGVCSESGCICIYPYVGIDCLSMVITVPPFNTSQPSTDFVPVTCENTGYGLTINSSDGVNCTGYGITECIDNISGSTCSTDQPTGKIYCGTTMTSYGSNSITCTGTHIECRSFYVKCSIILDNGFHVNDIKSTSNIVKFNNNQQIIMDQSMSSSSSSTLSQISNLNFLILVSIISLSLSLLF